MDILDSLWVGVRMASIRRQTSSYLPSSTASPSFYCSTKLYCLVTEAGVRERLARGGTRQRSGWDLNPRPLDHKSDWYKDAVALRVKNSVFVFLISWSNRALFVMHKHELYHTVASSALYVGICFQVSEDEWRPLLREQRALRLQQIWIAMKHTKRWQIL